MLFNFIDIVKHHPSLTMFCILTRAYVLTRDKIYILDQYTNINNK